VDGGVTTIFGDRRALPIPDALNQVLLGVFPVVVTELRQRQPERPPLP
jgi:hypothetical protein